MPVAITVALVIATPGPIPRAPAESVVRAKGQNSEEPILPPSEIDARINRGDLAGALELAEQSLRVCAPQPEITARCVLLLVKAGIMATRTGNPALGETRIKKAIGLAQAYGDESTNIYVAEARLALAYTFLSQERYAEAYEQAKRGRAIFVKVKTENSPMVVQAELLLGRAALGLGDGVLAKRHFESAASIVTRAVGSDDHPTVALAYGLIGVSLEQLGREEEAVLYFRYALATFRKKFPEVHENIAGASVDLGRCLSTLGRWSEADLHLRRAISIYRIAGGENAPQLASAYNNLATNLTRQNRLNEAEPFLRRAYSVALANGNLESRAVTLAALAELEKRRGNFAKSELYLRHALAVERREDDLDINRPNTFFSLSEMWTAQGIYPIQSYSMFEQGMDLLRRRREIYEDAGEREASDRETRIYGNDFEFQVRLSWNAAHALPPTRSEAK